MFKLRLKYNEVPQSCSKHPVAYNYNYILKNSVSQNLWVIDQF